LAKTDVSICNRNRIITGLRFLFRVTLRRLDLAEEVYHIREPQRLPLVMSVDEIKRLMAVASSLKTRVLLSLGYGCGLRASEIVRRGTNYANKVLDVLASQSRDVSMAVMLQQLVEFSACIGGQATEP
jgi:site-specific recombinase XerD